MNIIPRGSLTIDATDKCAVYTHKVFDWSANFSGVDVKVMFNRRKDYVFA